MLNQTQSESAFLNAVPIELVGGNSKRRIVIKPEDKRASQELRLDTAPTSVVVDPDNVILDESRVTRKK